MALQKCCRQRSFELNNYNSKWYKIKSFQTFLWVEWLQRKKFPLVGLICVANRAICKQCWESRSGRIRNFSWIRNYLFRIRIRQNAIFFFLCFNCKEKSVVWSFKKCNTWLTLLFAQLPTYMVIFQFSNMLK